ncbi:MAG: serine protease [Candidatus Nanopelagicaceae bacterium]|nr:serine protease [Candidatus Nanopelagicaceae bacterium]
MRKYLRVLFALTLLAGLFSSSPAYAAWTQYQSSPADTYNRSDLSPEYDITQVDFAVSDTALSEYWFFLDFSRPLTATRFADEIQSWAGILLDINLDGKVDYVISTPSTPYDKNFIQNGRFDDRTSGTPVLSDKCAAQTWTNLDKQATWIGFSIPKNCLPFGSILGIQGYSDQNGIDASNYDHAPNSFWNANLSGGVVVNPGNSTSTVVTGQLPSANLLGITSISSPSNPPTDLVSLSSSLAKSVVTVLCGNSLGSGWSINADLSAANTASGFKSYIISNHHVISECTSNRDIYIILSDQSRVSAYVYSWDEANDVAGILTSTFIEPLNWRGATPEQGWWSGIIGSPLGFPGVLTTGIVSSISSTKFTGTTTAPINHGNSGGPVFDRTGRVIGLATAKYIDSEGFGIFHGTPLLCFKIVNCTSASQIWTGANVITPTPTPTPTPTSTLTTATTKSSQSIGNWNLPATSSVTKSVLPFSVSATSGLPVVAVSKTEKICLVSESELILVAPGRCLVSMSQEGNSEFLAAPVKVVIITIAAVAKKTTIVCVKGKLVKKVTAVKPICPSGYTKKR